MSQIQLHLLDPRNEPVLTAGNQSIVEQDIVLKLQKLSLAELFGLGEATSGAWNEVILKNFILQMYAYTDATTLSGDDLKCLNGRLFQGLDKTIPCNTSGIHF